MAVYKNREVDVAFNLPTTNDEFVEVRYQDGEKEHVKASEVRFTKEEMDKLEKQHKLQMTAYNTVSDKELKDIRDSQDPEKIEKSLKEK